ncbi:hypothetical protein [Streptosporangium canum]|uniref:hypothetical protein n=1 Tax=Streptosporangium canum TaxID=324952 RepID=UPI0037A9F7B2
MRIATLALAVLFAGTLNLSSAPGAVAESAPTPSPTSTSPAPLIPDGAPKPYVHIERPESETHRKLAARKPDFGPEDKISRAWAAGRISVDEYIRHSVERVFNPPAVPRELRSDKAFPEGAGLQLGYALSLADQATPETRAWIEAFLKPQRAPSPDPGRARAAAAWTECGGGDGTWYGKPFACEHQVLTTKPIKIYYNIDGLVAGRDGVAAADANSNGIPDAIDVMARSFESAWKLYESWGYEGITGLTVNVYLGFDVNDNPGLTFPTGDLFQTGPLIFLKNDPAEQAGGYSPGRYEYLAYHELFHAFQYHYLPLDRLGWNVTSINWWMEATAEWATHQLYAKNNPTAAGWEFYASNLDLFYSTPDHALNEAQSVWSGTKRQYGLFPLVQYLTERTHVGFVLHTWERMSEELPAEAIKAVLEGYGRDVATELQGFALANYRLTSSSPNLSSFLPGKDGYVDGHAGGLWKNLVQGLGGRPKRSAERSLTWGGSVTDTVLTHPGGAAYLEFTAPPTGTGRVTVRLQRSGGVGLGAKTRYLLVTWQDVAGKPSTTPLRWTRGEIDGGEPGEVSVALKGGEIATLIVTRGDLVGDSGSAQSSTYAQEYTWTASMAVEGGVKENAALTNMFKNYGDNAGCADWSGGDATQSVKLPSGKRAWFFSDTILGNPSKRPGGFETSFIRNSIVVQDNSSLRTITGGNTCKETDTSIDFWSRYAHTPVGQGSQYWTGDAKVVGGEVAKFYYKGIGDEHTRGAYVRFPVSALESGTVVNRTPVALEDCSVQAPYPIIWGTALVDQGGHTYIYGFESKATFSKRVFLARANQNNSPTVQSQWEYYAGLDGNGDPRWADTCSSSQPLMPMTEAGFSVSYINNQFWLVHHADPHVTPGAIVANPSRTPWGFTNNRVSLYSPPEAHTNPNYYAIYEARVQPELSSDPNKIVIAYNVNTSAVNIGCRVRTDYYPDTYRPRFIDVPKTMFFSPTAFKASPTPVTSQAAPSRNAPAEGAAVGRGIHPPAFTDTGRPPNAPPPPPDGKLPSAEETRAAAESSALAPDNSWYDNEVEPQRSNGGCPRLQDRKASGLTATVQPQGHVNLRWDDVGQGVWYWLWHRDATAGESWKKYELWNNKPEARVDPIGGPWNHGHTFEWYVVPFSSTKGTIEGDKSNTESKAVQVARPAAPTGVTATGSGANTVKMSWNGVTYPSSGVYYYIYYWTGSQAPVKIGPWGENSRDALVSPLAGGQNHCFQMTAENMGGESAKSNTVCAVVP